MLHIVLPAEYTSAGSSLSKVCEPGVCMSGQEIRGPVSTNRVALGHPVHPLQAAHFSEVRHHGVAESVWVVGIAEEKQVVWFDVAVDKSTVVHGRQAKHHIVKHKCPVHARMTLMLAHLAPAAQFAVSFW